MPEEAFSFDRYGKRQAVCKECVAEKKRATHAAKAEAMNKGFEAQVKNARNLRIHDFTPRELMEELARRGYRGKLEYVETKVIDITNF